MNETDELVAESGIDQDVLDSFRKLPGEDDLPYDDGIPMETIRHREQMNLLIDVLQLHWTERRDYFVGGNMFLHYDLNDKRHFRGPDFFLVLDVEQRERKSWVVWQEGMRFPDLIIELLSDTTRKIDFGEKKTLYARVFHTPEYFLYDPYSQEFIGYRLQGFDYQEIEPDTEGRLYSQATNLYLAVRNNWLRWLTPQGIVLPSPREQLEQELQHVEQERQRTEQERQRAEQERQRADNAERRAERLAAKLRQLGIDPNGND